MNRNVWLLFICQSLIGTAAFCQVAITALIGNSLAVDKSLATLPYALQMLGTMCASIPAGLIFARLGRRAGFLVGALATLAGTVLFGIGVQRRDFLLYCLGALPMGIGFGIGQHYRFAAAEVADAAARSRAIALVMGGGLVAALLGPEIIRHTKDAMPPLLFVGTYMTMAVLPLICMLLLAVVRLPPAPRRESSATPVAAIIARPAFITAVTAGLVAYGSMNLIMTATPLQMMLCGFGVDDSTGIIQAHSIAMFAPGFLTGRLIGRFGVHRVICAGAALSVGCAALSLTGSAYMTFIVALSMLGVGWNLMFVGATALLATAHDAVDRVRAQAANDFIVFGTVTATSFSAGALQNGAGWTAVNAAVVLPILGALVLVLWHRARRAQLAAA
jgi:predicted MFS family arabinose efflux permease